MNKTPPELSIPFRRNKRPFFSPVDMFGKKFSKKRAVSPLSVDSSEKSFDFMNDVASGPNTPKTPASHFLMKTPGESSKDRDSPLSVASPDVFCVTPATVTITGDLHYGIATPIPIRIATPQAVKPDNELDIFEKIYDSLPLIFLGATIVLMILKAFNETNDSSNNDFMVPSDSEASIGFMQGLMSLRSHSGIVVQSVQTFTDTQVEIALESIKFAAAAAVATQIFVDSSLKTAFTFIVETLTTIINDLNLIGNSVGNKMNMIFTKFSSGSKKAISASGNAITSGVEFVKTESVKSVKTSVNAIQPLASKMTTATGNTLNKIKAIKIEHFSASL